MKKEDWQALLKKCFGKEKDERLHAIAMLIIWGIFILILVIMIRLSPTPDEQTTTPNDNKDNQNTEFTKIMEKYNVKQCLYGHLHGKAHAKAFEGTKNNIEYIMVSCDYTNFELVKIK